MSEEKISHAPKPKGFFLPLVAGGKLAIVVAGEEKTNNEYDERVVYETQ